MGKKILKRHFDKTDCDEFSHRIKQETALLREWCKAGMLLEDVNESGFELEMWLLNNNFKPANNNLEFIKNSPIKNLVSEAAQSCIEINVPFDTLHEHTFSRHHQHLNEIIKECHLQATGSNQHIISIGTLPTAQQSDFSVFNLTDENRYHAINHRLTTLAENAPSYLHITGNQILDMSVESFCMVGAISSFQIHCRLGVDKSARFYNAAIALSAPTVAVCANSPYLFGRDLWEESRIPFYEQILLRKTPSDKLPRVFFGTGYIKNSVLDLFIENIDCYVPLVPQVFDLGADKMAHLQLHNGNIYRWNRPILDFDKQARPHFRIEHRPLAAGPSVPDMIANAAFYYGITHYHTTENNPLENQMPFEVAKNNFYLAARYGLKAEISWINNEKITLQKLIVERLLPQAKEGLNQLDIDATEAEYYLSIIEERVIKNKTGSQWQRQFFNKNDHDFATLVKAYIHFQQSGNPVHDWPIE